MVDEYNSYDKKLLTKTEFQTLGDKFYYNYRDIPAKNDFDAALGFYFIRQLSFSGMIRYNSKGQFNVPFGWYKKMHGINQEEKLIKNILNNTEILCGDWKKSVQNSSSEDFIFLDPPYTTTFKDYNFGAGSAFGKEQHIELYDWFANTSSKVLIILNYDDFTGKLYENHIKEKYGHNYSIKYKDRVSKEDSANIHFVATNYDVKIKKDSILE